MGFLFTSKKKEKLVAIFDIGSGSVGGALVSIPLDKKSLPTIIKSIRADIVTRKEVDFNLFLKDMILSLNFASKSLYESRLGAPEEIICVLASPWYTSETRLIKMSKESPFTFNNKVVDGLLAKEFSSLNILYKNKYGEVESKPEIIEHPIIGVLLDGHHVDEPLGKKTNSIEINMIVSLTPKICLDKIKDTISKSFHSAPIYFSSFIVASYIAVRDKYVHQDSYLLLDIGGEVTDIGIVTNGILNDSISFPYGKKTLFRDICNKLKIEQRDAYEIFSLLNKTTLSDKEKEKLKPVLESVKKSWGNLFRESINSLSHISKLPNVMFLTIDADIKDWFVKIINNDEYIESMVPDKNFILITLDGGEFLNMCNVKNGTCDPFLMIESINVMRKM